MPRLLQLVHGFPPHQNAGTEQYAARLAAGLRARGWSVHTLAATQRPGAPMYSVEEAPGLTRMVHNAPWAGLRAGGADPAVDATIAGLVARERPDLVHVQHVASLSTTWTSPVPVVWTLHDAWAWCPAGGQLVDRTTGAPCEGPGPGCAACAGMEAHDAPLVTGALHAAGMAARVVRPERVHALWKRLPAGVRGWVGSRRGPPLSEADVRLWRARHAALATRATLVSPSRWLAAEATRHGLGAVRVIPHGVDVTAPPRAVGIDAPFVFLGTLAPHKGPHLVVEAHRASGVGAPLHLYGPPGPDPRFVATLPHRGPVPAEMVPRLLAGARALVMGSTWPENAPLVALEARAAGCPVIAPAIGGLPEIVVEGRDGWLYPPGDTPALAAALRAAMGSPPPVAPPPSFADHLTALLGVYDSALARAR